MVAMFYSVVVEPSEFTATVAVGTAATGAVVVVVDVVVAVVAGVLCSGGVVVKVRITMIRTPITLVTIPMWVPSSA